jgi:hypothetical protein
VLALEPFTEAQDRYRQNEGGQFVEQQSFQHGQCRSRHQKIIPARSPLDPQRECRHLRAAAFASFVRDRGTSAAA